MATVQRALPQRAACVYTSCYCEENVWLLCEHIQKHKPEELQNFYVLFISNQNKTIPIWKQKARQDTPNMPVVWDYHVIALHTSSDEPMIYDLDTTLSFPCTLRTYVNEAMGSEMHINPTFHRMFRIIRAADFLANFASDRSHMRKEDGTWMAEPPSYPCISTTNSTHNLATFIDMTPGSGCGDVMSLQGFIEKFSPKETFTQLPSLLR